MRRRDHPGDPDWLRRWRRGLCTHCALPLISRESYDTDNSGQRYPTATCRDCATLGRGIVVQLGQP